MIRHFRDKRSFEVFEGRRPKGVGSDVASAAFRKLRLLDAATALDQLRSPPGNRLELLKGDRRGQHSIRVNDQFRICFEWREDGAYMVELTDYH